MKSFVKSFIMFFALLASFSAKADNILSIKDLSMKAGETVMVDINLDNTDPVCSFAINISFPEGFSSSQKKSATVLTERDYIDEDIENTKVFGARTWDNQELTLIVYDDNSVPFSGNSGSICRFTLTASDAIAAGEYEFNVTKAEVSTPDAVSYETPDFTFKVKILPSTIDVTGISLDKTSLSLNVGETASLVATVAPADATDKNVKWTSSNEAVATVSAEGVVTAVSAGKAVITVTSANGKTATCDVDVTVPVIDVTGISLDKTSLSLNVGETASLVATVAPADATDKNVKWTSSNEAVATVSEAGVVTAVSAGKAVITVTSANGKTATCDVDVTVPVIDVTGIILDKTSLSLNVGETASLVATVAPADATDKTVSWTSSNVAVATVSEAGVVTAVSAGKAVITVTSANGHTATCDVDVTVPVIDVASITLNQTELVLEIGASQALEATVAPADATDKNVTWTTSDEAVATVSAEGVVTAVSAGKAIITVASANGVTATCAVTVNEPDAILGISADAAADVLYTLGGVRVSRANAQKGVYIVNGKKVVLK